MVISDYDTSAGSSDYDSGLDHAIPYVVGKFTNELRLRQKLPGEKKFSDRRRYI